MATRSIVAGLGTGTDDAEVWQYNGSTWSQIGGDDVNGSWTAGTYEEVKVMSVYDGELYVGIGTTAGDGEDGDGRHTGRPEAADD